MNAIRRGSTLKKVDLEEVQRQKEESKKNEVGGMFGEFSCDRFLVIIFFDVSIILFTCFTLTNYMYHTILKFQEVMLLKLSCEGVK